MLGALRSYGAIAVSTAVLVGVLLLHVGGMPSAGRVAATVFVGVYMVWTIIGMVHDALRGRIGLDVLAVVAMAATLAVGEYIASLIVVLMLSGGRALEEFASRRARGDLTALMKRAPRIAHLLKTSAGGEDRVDDCAVDDVKVGDLLLVRPSEIVPVDGTLVGSDASFDESSLTGESLPVTRDEGEEVLSGAINGTRAAVIRASRRSADSQYQQIVALVRDAQESRAPVVRLADRFAVPFTAGALVLAVAAWAVSGAPSRFAEVLVLATPCPLLIAAPVAFLGGLSRAAKSGVILKSGAVIEQLARVRAVAFDKTGTLTEGRPRLVSVRPTSGLDPDELLRLAASAEQYSSHAFAETIRRDAEQRGIRLVSASDATEVATNGVAGTFGDHRVAVGKPAYIESLVPDLARVDPSAAEGVVYVAVDRRFGGTLIVADEPRAESRRVVEWMLRHGVERVVMLTGDTLSTASAVAQLVGISEVHAELLPSEKARLAAELRPRPVMMVGDGVNDAPVLAAADVGVAMGARGATAAGEAADVVVLVDSLDAIVTAMSVGKRTLRVALTAIWIGIVLSIGLMLVATSGIIPALVGALLQEVVDLATILYALKALSAGRRAAWGHAARDADESQRHARTARPEHRDR
ncbi:Cadmium, zinc and cobalt-transporting ATPase [Microbacterium sp. TNHR37B]|nr:Cadmium, zinc and cobalt-transporting ATPase [Microbacterium sp. TNHR37B]